MRVTAPAELVRESPSAGYDSRPALAADASDRSSTVDPTLHDANPKFNSAISSIYESLAARGRSRARSQGSQRGPHEPCDGVALRDTRFTQGPGTTT